MGGGAGGGAGGVGVGWGVGWVGCSATFQKQKDTGSLAFACRGPESWLWLQGQEYTVEISGGRQGTCWNLVLHPSGPSSPSSLIIQGSSSLSQMLEALFAWEEPPSYVLLKSLPIISPSRHSSHFFFFFLLNLFLPSHCMFHQSRNDFTNNHTITPCLEHCELSGNI